MGTSGGRLTAATTGAGGEGEARGAPAAVAPPIGSADAMGGRLPEEANVRGGATFAGTPAGGAAFSGAVVGAPAEATAPTAPTADGMPGAATALVPACSCTGEPDLTPAPPGTAASNVNDLDDERRRGSSPRGAPAGRASSAAVDLASSEPDDAVLGALRRPPAAGGFGDGGGLPALKAPFGASTPAPDPAVAEEVVAGASMRRRARGLGLFAVSGAVATPCAAIARPDCAFRGDARFPARTSSSLCARNAVRMALYACARASPSAHAFRCARAVSTWFTFLSSMSRVTGFSSTHSTLGWRTASATSRLPVKEEL